MMIRNMDIDTFLSEVKKFHGHLAPGMVCGGFMVELAFKNLPEDGFYDVISETSSCLPDSVQLLTPCTIGNGWLKIMDSGRFSLIFYNKHTGKGVRVALDPERLKNWSEIHTWAMKLKPKKEQDKKRLFKEIIEAGFSIYKVEKIFVSRDKFPKKGRISVCTSCGESFRGDGLKKICKACDNDMPFEVLKSSPDLNSIPVEEVAGKTALHDMTKIEPGEKKGPEFKKGQKFQDSDIDILKSMGKENIHVSEVDTLEKDLKEKIHEDEAAIAFAERMKGKGIYFKPVPVEGKIDLLAEYDGVLKVESSLLKKFNMSGNVMCASRRSFMPVKKDMIVAGTRAIPIYLEKEEFDSAIETIKKPLFSVFPYKLERAGIVVTGSEVASGRIEDRFTGLIEKTLAQYDVLVQSKTICPDKRDIISGEVSNMVENGVELVVVTGGLSVDPDDVTRSALLDSGLVDEIYGTPFLPGAMTLIGRIKNTRIIGVPAGALYSDRTAFDLILPLVLADLDMTREDIAGMSHGGFLDSGRRIF